MKINDIFKIEQYDEAYAFVSTHENTTIKDLGNGEYQIVEIVVPEPTVEEQNEAIRKKREELYRAESDPLKMDYDEASARGEATAEQLKTDWLASKDKIRAENPYVKNS